MSPVQGEDRLASPAERWGGFGTCVRSKATGPYSSPTPEVQPSNDSDNGAARQDTQQKGLSLPRRSPGVATGQPLCASLADSDLLTPSAKVPNAGGYLPHKLMGTHSDLLLPPTVQDRVPARRLGPDYLQHGPG